MPCEYENWSREDYYCGDPWIKEGKDITYEKMVKQLEKTEEDFNQTFGHPVDNRPFGSHKDDSIIHGTIKTQDGKSYIQIDGIDHELDFDDPESIGKLITKSVAKHLLEES